MQLPDPVTLTPITLRQVDSGDAVFLDSLHEDGEYAFFAVNRRPTLPEIEQQILEARSPAVDFRIICSAATNSALGWVRADLDFDDGNARLGYGLAPRYWGHGYATGAVRAMVDSLFDRGDIFKVWARVDPRNERSMKVLPRAGFNLEGTLESHVVRRGERASRALFGLTHQRWQETHQPQGGRGGRVGVESPLV